MIDHFTVVNLSWNGCFSCSYHLQANLEEKIKVLQEEVDLCAQKEVITDYHAKCHHRVPLKLAIFHAFSVGVESVEVSAFGFS